MNDADPDQRDQRARDIFLRLIEIPFSEARAAYLEGACQNDSPLRSQVDALMENHWGDTFLDYSAVEGLPTTLDDSPVLEGPGSQIGKYKLLQQIGEGGMGIVYLAEQAGDLRRRVALKIIKLGMDTKSVVARFETERQVLALMNHPNIAKVLDAGATETGRPYFVMELVRGVPITKYCDQQKLSTRERLDLFILVCQAIQHAHQKGIIHRDIKPSNVMIALFDGRPVPMVIDFGIAKATNQRLTEQTVFTNFGQFMGTPAYMSPEQAEGSQLDIDTRSDIYSLGVLLYELITGSTPFLKQRLQNAGLKELQRILLEEEPPRPSTRLNTIQKEERTKLAKCRGTENSTVGQFFHNDLDWIVMRAIEKDRTRRYDTANGLAMDVRRYLNNQTVLAVAPTVSYKLTKFVQRNRTMVTVTVTIAILLLVAITTSTWMWLLATRAKNNQIAQRQLAQQALLETRDTLQRMQIQKAEEMFRNAQWSQGIGYLGQVLCANPSNQVAAARLASMLIERTPVAIPSTEPLRHEATVSSAQFSPDGRQVVTASEDKTAQVWTVKTGQPLGSPLRHEGLVASAQFSPDGRSVVTASEDKTAQVWTVKTGQPLGSPLRHEGPVASAQFSPDGRSVVTASHDKTAQVWDAITGNRLTEPLLHEDRVKSAQFSPDGERVVTSSDDQTVRVWDAQTGKLQLKPIRHQASLNSAEFSPDGQRILTACDDNTARIWDSNTGQPLVSPLRHASAVKSAHFSQNGRRIVTASNDASARIWDADTGLPITTPLRHGYELTSAEFSPDSRMVVTASYDKTARIWDANSGQLLFEPLRHGNLVWTAKFSRDGDKLVTSSNDKTARLWDVNTGQSLSLRLQHGRDVNSACFSPDGQRLVTASDDMMAQVWDAKTGQPLGEPLRHKNWVSSAKFSPDGRRVVTASYDKTARIWDANSGQPLHEPLQHTHTVKSAEFSPDGQRVVTASYDGTARVWDANSGQPLTSPLHHDGQVISAKFSPDGQSVVTGSDDQTVRLWDANTGKPLTSPLRHDGKVKSVEFSPDGERVLTASGVLQRAGETLHGAARVWDTKTGQPLTGPMRHEDQVQSAQFSPDGQRIVTASDDKTVRVWDASTGTPLTEPMHHEGKLYSAKFSPNGQLVVTASWDKTARVWDSHTGLSVTGPLQHDENVYFAQFSPDGQQVATASYDHTARVWDVSTPPIPVPNWFLDWAGARVGRQMTRSGLGDPVSFTDYRKQREFVAARTGNDFYTRIARWVQADASNRTISPNATLTVPEYIIHCIAENTLESLNEAIYVAPKSPTAFARLASLLTDQNPRRLEEAEYFARQALKLAPDDDGAHKVLERIQSLK